MKLVFISHIILLGLWAGPTFGFGINNHCSRSFDSNTKVAHIIANVSPSLAVSRGRYELEEFVTETVGADFSRGTQQIQVDIKIVNSDTEIVLKKISALGISLVVSEDVPDDDTVVTVYANARDLINLLDKLARKNYFLTSTYNPRSQIFGLEI